MRSRPLPGQLFQRVLDFEELKPFVFFLSSRSEQARLPTLCPQPCRVLAVRCRASHGGHEVQAAV